MPHKYDVMQHGCPCGDDRQAWLFGFSDLFGVEGDHGGVVIARLEHNQILAGAEGVGVGGHRFDGHAGLTSLLADFVAGAHLSGVDGLVAGQRDLDAVGAGEHGGSAAIFTAVGDIGPGIVEATSLQRGVIAQVEDAGNRLFAGG